MYKALSVTFYRTAINVSDNVFQSQPLEVILSFIQFLHCNLCKSNMVANSNIKNLMKLNITSNSCH